MHTELIEQCRDAMQAACDATEREDDPANLPTEILQQLGYAIAALDESPRQIVELVSDQTHVDMPQAERELAFQSAFRVTMSRHEWTWRPTEQARMTRLCLWACQRLDAVTQIASGRPIRRIEG